MLYKLDGGACACVWLTSAVALRCCCWVVAPNSFVPRRRCPLSCAVHPPCVQPASPGPSVRPSFVDVDPASPPRMEIIGLETTDSVNWHSAVDTSWDLSCSIATSAGTGPNTAGLLFLESRATTRFTCLAIQVTPATMHFAIATEWCSTRTTEKTILTRTAQLTTVEDSGTSHAFTAESTQVVQGRSDSPHRQLEICICMWLTC